VTSRKMRCQLRREQIGIAAGNQQPKSLPLQAIDKQLPPGKILALVKKQVTRISVDSLNGTYDFILISDGGQPFVIEIDIAVSAGLLNQSAGIKRLAGAPRAGDDLDPIIARIQRNRQATFDKGFLKACFQFLLLDKNVIFKLTR
jgi:hypothetical protein